MRSKGTYKMDYEKAINTAVGCVMDSGLSMQEKQNVINALREIEEKVTEETE
ncbi:MAG: hypothetical protein SCK28_04580 [Bacillota bacterium]|nr:hypothetical protein [Bacillota bacterium]